MKTLLDRYRITNGDGFRLKDHDPADTGGALGQHEDAEARLKAGIERLSALQEKMYAEARWALLAVIQAMDAAGKDGTIQHVLTGVNPQGVTVTPFKQPGPNELAHDFLWRVHAALPERGRIGIFNRSHYEEVLVVRVHPDILDRQCLPDAVRGDKFWKHRLQDIAAWEHYLSRQGIVILKFFLHVSKQEQRRRFLARLDTPDKNWKFSVGDIAERAHWDEYQDAYERAIRGTAAPYAPWFVVPADHKWFTHLVVVEALIEALEALDLKPPVPSEAERAALAAARAQLEAE